MTTVISCKFKLQDHLKTQVPLIIQRKDSLPPNRFGTAQLAHCESRSVHLSLRVGVGLSVSLSATVVVVLQVVVVVVVVPLQLL